MNDFFDAEQLLKHLCAGGNSDAGYELLAQFQRGYPLENLQRLLRSDKVPAAKAGAWISSELGIGIAPVVNELAEFLQHELDYVRFFLLDAILVGTTNQHGPVIADAIKLIQDSSDAVRWKALILLARASRAQLLAARRFIANELAGHMDWMLSVSDASDASSIIVELDTSKPPRCLFAAAAAARIATTDLRALEHAATAQDEDVGWFARVELESYAAPPDR